MKIKKIALLMIVVAILSVISLAESQNENNGQGEMKGQDDVEIEHYDSDNENETDSDNNETEENEEEAESDDDEVEENEEETESDDDEVEENEEETEGDDDEIEENEEETTENKGKGKPENAGKSDETPGNEKRNKAQENERNTNQVRETVHALLAMENRTGGIGKNVSAVAKNFNNSIMSAMKNEEKIQDRSKFKRFFAGGDHKVADEMLSQLNKSKAEVQNLKKIQEDCSCDAEAKEVMEIQIKSMLEQNERLQELAQNEKKSKGIFGWIWK